MGNQTRKGASQIKTLNPFVVQQAETVAATQCVQFEQSGDAGNMLVKVAKDQGMLQVRGVHFDKDTNKLEVYASGKGTIEVRQDRSEGEIIATVEVNNKELKQYEVKTTKTLNGTMDICFILKGESLRFDKWLFK